MDEEEYDRYLDEVADLTGALDDAFEAFQPDDATEWELNQIAQDHEGYDD